MTYIARFRGFPQAGISHPVTNLKTHSIMSVTKEERELVLADRKKKDMRHRVKRYIQWKDAVIDTYNNFKV